MPASAARESRDDKAKRAQVASFVGGDERLDR
jgi:hypothetical protein